MREYFWISESLYKFCIAALISQQKLNILRQHKFVLMTSWKAESEMSFMERKNQGVSRAVCPLGHTDYPQFLAFGPAPLGLSSPFFCHITFFLLWSQIPFCLLTRLLVNISRAHEDNHRLVCLSQCPSLSHVCKVPFAMHGNIHKVQRSGWNFFGSRYSANHNSFRN